MDRTKSRPIPAGKIASSNVLILSISLILLGSLILILWTNFLTLGLGLLNLFWYNFVYTMLKRVTPFAIIPGSLVGAIPPIIGWTSTGASLVDPQIIVIAFFFFIWQIPHFWLLLLVLDKDYKQGGFPTLTQVFSRQQLSRITFIWVSSTAVTGLMIPLFGLVNDFWIAIALFLCSMWLTWKAFSLLGDSEDYSVFRYNFRYINYFALSVVILVSFDKLFL
jgi:protoheme IX farnesyltransferase